MNLPAWSSLIPPVTTLIAAGITKNVSLSLLLGIALGGYLVADFSVTEGLYFSIGKIVNQLSEPNTLTLFAFLSLLAVIIELMRISGGVAAYVSLLQNRIKNKKHAEYAVICFSAIFSIDDYINNMLTGAIIRPFAERFSIAREKIAFLLNSLSSPLVAIIPASTWAAMIITRLEDGGISLTKTSKQLIVADPFFVYLHTIPCIFYSFLIVASTIYIVQKGIKYGAMARLENNIEQLHHRQQENASTQTLTRKESIAGFLIPLACFFLFLPLFLLYLGNSSLFGGPHSILEALKSTNIMASFCYTSGIASLILALFLLQQKKEKPLHLVKLIFTSAWSMKNSFKILTLAFTLGAIISQDLHAGSYIAKLICCNLSSFLLPLIVFILATASTASTGSSWGTIAIITPLALQTLAVLSQQALPIGLEHIPLLYQTIGAILSGAVAGAHLSPLTEATIISATAAQANHLLHVKTQVQYALPAFFVTSLLFLATGLAPVLAQSSLYMWGLVGIGIFATIRLIAILGKQTQK